MKHDASSTSETLIRGLDKLMLQRGYKTYKNLAEEADINYNTLKSWMNKTKTPRLNTLDKMCNNLKINTSELFSVKPNFEEIKKDVENNSRNKVRINISRFMLERTKLSENDCVAFFEGEISRAQYISYTRKQFGRVIPLDKLGIIAHFLNVQIWELLK